MRHRATSTGSSAPPSASCQRCHREQCRSPGSSPVRVCPCWQIEELSAGEGWGRADRGTDERKVIKQTKNGEAEQNHTPSWKRCLHYTDQQALNPGVYVRERERNKNPQKETYVYQSVICSFTGTCRWRSTWINTGADNPAAHACLGSGVHFSHS